ncbi:hypothetical protein ACP275_07G089700 [Erythranthe tilingii]
MEQHDGGPPVSNCGGVRVAEYKWKNNGGGQWITYVICEIWFALSWILNQFPMLYPIETETYLDRLSFRYEKEGKPSELAHTYVFVSNVDPMREPPLITANTVLSILAVDYPVDKVSCYISDDGAAIPTLEALSVSSEFARKWVLFTKKFNIEPRAPEWYYYQKIVYLKNKEHPAFVRVRRAINVCVYIENICIVFFKCVFFYMMFVYIWVQRKYEFKIRINRLVVTAEKIPEEGWTMQDGTPLMCGTTLV